MSFRLTLIGSRRRVDAALPREIPVAELIPDVLELLGENANGAAQEWGLVRIGGRALDLEQSLADQGIEDGTMLFLLDRASAMAAPIFEDYAEEVAVAVDAQPGRWNAGMLAPALTAGAAVAAVAAGLVELVAGDARGRAVLGGIGVIVVTAAALAVVGALRRRRLAAALLFSSLLLWAAAGTGIAGLGHATLLPLIASALGAIALGALVAIVIAGDEAIAIAAGILAATLVPAVAGAGVAVFGGAPVAAAALVVPVELGAIALSAPVTVRLAALAEVNLQALETRLAGGRMLMAALLIGASVAIAASCVVLATSAQWPAWALVGAAAIAIVLRARHFRFAAEIVPLLSAGFIALLSLEVPLALWLGFTPRGIPELASLFIADVAVLVAAMALVPRWEITPAIKPWLDRVEVTAIAASVPLAAGAIGAFDAALHFARGLGQ